MLYHFFIKYHILRLCGGKACSVVFLQEINKLGYVRFKSCGVVFETISLGYVRFKSCYVVFFKDHFLRLCGCKACNVVFEVVLYKRSLTYKVMLGLSHVVLFFYKRLFSQDMLGFRLVMSFILPMSTFLGYGSVSLGVSFFIIDHFLRLC